MSRSEIDKKTYLGDGVYSEFDGYNIKLTTSDRIDSYDSNVIYLEPEVLLNLMNHVNRVSLYRSLKRAETKEDEFI